jgi:hypothetical protein
MVDTMLPMGSVMNGVMMISSSLPRRVAAVLKATSFAALFCLALAGCTQDQLASLRLPSWAGEGASGQTQEAYPPLDSSAAVAAAPVGTHAVQCKVGLGSARFSAGWYDFDVTTFALVDGQAVNVPLRHGNSKDVMTFQGVFDDSGQRMVFCPVISGPPGKRVACSSLYMLDDDLTAGIRRTFDIPDAVRGATITCAFDPAHFAKLEPAKK